MEKYSGNGAGDARTSRKRADEACEYTPGKRISNENYHFIGQVFVQVANTVLDARFKSWVQWIANLLEVKFQGNLSIKKN